MTTRFIRGMFVRGVYPLFYMLARLFGTDSERLQRILVRTSNSLVRREFRGKTASRLLLLLPHCLQREECKIRITSNIFNCARCGKCNIKGLIELAEELGLNLYVATGGTLARRVVKETRPQAIVAVACERDLSSGITDTYPLPVLGVLNDRPHGPCLNTLVDLSKVREAIEFFSGNNA